MTDATNFCRGCKDRQDRIEKLEAALHRQCDNMAFILNHATSPDAWYSKFIDELETDRAALKGQS